MLAPDLLLDQLSLEDKQMRARSAGNPHAACDVEGLEMWHGWRSDLTGTPAWTLGASARRQNAIYVRSGRVGQPVRESFMRLITQKPKLKLR
jgi:hypothetical protein